MGSGPRAGLSEIFLPELQKGSSIMPGKVNPVIPEVVTQVAAQVIGNDTAITVGGMGGHFELNVYIPLMARNLLQSIGLLASASRLLAEKCVDGIEANRERNEQYAESTLAAATALNPFIGYDKATEIVKEATASGRPLREVAREAGVDDADPRPGARLPRDGEAARLSRFGFADRRSLDTGEFVARVVRRRITKGRHRCESFWRSSAALVGALAIGLAPAGAITDGVPDGTTTTRTSGSWSSTIEDDVPLWRCTGTLLSPTVYLTAGHCTEPASSRRGRSGSATAIRRRVGSTDSTGFRSPVTCGGTSDRAIRARTTTSNRGFYRTRDVGVVDPRRAGRPMPSTATLPGRNSLDAVSSRRSKTSFDAVGYGLQRSSARSRSTTSRFARGMIAHREARADQRPGFVGDFAMQTVQQLEHAAGTLLRRLGRPELPRPARTSSSAVTSFGTNVNCAGTDGAYRIDQLEDDLDWLVNGFVD